MFEAKLKNGSCPELDPVAVEFPIPEDRYEETIRALEAINIGRAGKQDCRIEEVFSANCPGLGRLVGTICRGLTFTKLYYRHRTDAPRPNLF